MCAKITKNIPRRRNPKQLVCKDVDLNSVQSNNLQRPSTTEIQSNFVSFSNFASDPSNLLRNAAETDKTEKNDDSSDGSHEIDYTPVTPELAFPQ